MKMKKVLTLTLAGIMLTGTTLTAAAAKDTPGFNPPVQADQEVDFNSETQSSDSAEIPVYGYVGPDAVLIDEDPDDKDTLPTPTETTDTDYQINVSVPVKILWAVFESDTDGSGSGIGIGTVTSPDYYIRNNSEQLGASVAAASFAAKTGSGDNAYVDSNWTEALTLTSQNALMTQDVALDKTDVTLGNLRPEQQMEFNVNGKLDVDAVDTDFEAAHSGETILESDLTNVLQPEYELILTISALAL